MKLKTITDKSWLVLSDDGQHRVGLLSEQRDKFILIAKDLKTVFENEKEVSEFFSQDIFENVITTGLKTSPTEHFIKGYPVDFDNPFEADSEDELSKLPLYTKTSGSKIYYSAGYFCLSFPKGWMPAYCPKLSTLNKYDHKGPFAMDREMKCILNKCRRENDSN